LLILIRKRAAHDRFYEGKPQEQNRRAVRAKKRRRA
jgi:hypothetical protein